MRSTDQATPRTGPAHRRAILASVLLVGVSLCGVALIKAGLVDVSGIPLLGRLASPLDVGAVPIPAAPSGAAATATRTYMAKAGMPLRSMLNTTDNLPDTNTLAGCRVVAADLSRLGSPQTLAGLAAGIPDHNTRDAAVNYVSAVSGYLSSCGEMPDLSDAHTEVADSAVILRRLLAQDDAA